MNCTIIYVVLVDQTRGRRMEGGDGPTELWRLPYDDNFWHLKRMGKFYLGHKPN